MLILETLHCDDNCAWAGFLGYDWSKMGILCGQNKTDDVIMEEYIMMSLWQSSFTDTAALSVLLMHADKVCVPKELKR